MTTCISQENPLSCLEEKELKISPERFQQIIGISQMIPGPHATSLTLIGYPLGGIFAMLAIYLGLLLPGLILAPLLVHTYRSVSSWSYFKYFKVGVHIAILAILLLFAIKLLRPMTDSFSGEWFLYLGVALSVFLLNDRFKFRPLFLMPFAGLIGYFFL